MKKLIGGGVIAGGAAVGATFIAPAPAPEPASAPQPSAQSVSYAGNALVQGLPARETIGRSRGDLFVPRDWAPRKPSPVVVKVPPVAPTPTPLPYRLAGQVVHGGKLQVVLAKADRVFTVQEADVLEDGYRVESVKPGRVILVYM